MNEFFDITVIGAGIVGLATAMKMAAKYPHLRLAVLEKESEPASHQSGHNSGVIHSGLYYRPGSLKARMCTDGARQLIDFCWRNNVPLETCGKLVIATRPEEISKLHELYRRGSANGLQDLRIVNRNEAKALEPYVNCMHGLHVPTTGIVNFRQVAKAYAAVYQSMGGKLFLNHRVTEIANVTSYVRLSTTQQTIFSRLVINCAGLYADHLVRLSGEQPPCQIVPFRGEYYQLKPERKHLVRNLIYPVPDPRFPFLGVHFTRMIDGKVEAGPNAVLAFAREGYEKSTVRWTELMQILHYKGFWRMAKRYWRSGWQEVMRSCSKHLFGNALRCLVPAIKDDDLIPAGAGVRAQALGRDGKLLDDFVILQKDQMTHVLNAPSPAATSSLAIADHIIQSVHLLLLEKGLI